MAAEDHVGVPDQPERRDHPAHVRQIAVPALPLRSFAGPDCLKEGLRLAVPQQGLHGTDGLQTAPHPAVAGSAVGVHHDMLKHRAPARYSGQDLPVPDHGAAQMPAHGEIIRVLQLRRAPELRERRGVRVVDIAAGIREPAGKGVDFQACAVQDLSIKHLAAVRRDQTRNGDPDPQDLLLPQRKRGNEFQHQIADPAEISLILFKPDLGDRSAQILPVEIHSHDFHKPAHDLHADGHAVIRHDGIGGRLPSDGVGIELTVFVDQPHLLHLRKRSGNRGAAQPQGVADLLLGDLFFCIDMPVNLLTVRLFDLAGRNSGRHGKPPAYAAVK